MGCSASKEIPSDPEQYGRSGEDGAGAGTSKGGRVKNMLRAPLKRLQRTHSACSVDSKHKDKAGAGEETISASAAGTSHASRPHTVPDEDIPYADEYIELYRPEPTDGHVTRTRESTPFQSPQPSNGSVSLVDTSFHHGHAAELNTSTPVKKPAADHQKQLQNNKRESAGVSNDTNSKHDLFKASTAVTPSTTSDDVIVSQKTQQVSEPPKNVTFVPAQNQQSEDHHASAFDEEVIARQLQPVEESVTTVNHAKHFSDDREGQQSSPAAVPAASSQWVVEEETQQLEIARPEATPAAGAECDGQQQVELPHLPEAGNVTTEEELVQPAIVSPSVESMPAPVYNEPREPVDHILDAAETRVQEPATVEDHQVLPQQNDQPALVPPEEQPAAVQQEDQPTTELQQQHVIVSHTEVQPEPTQQESLVESVSIEQQEAPAESAPIETVVEPTPEPIIEPTRDPVIEPTSDPVIESTSDPVIEPTPDPIIEPTRDPVIEPTRDPIIEPTPELPAEHTPAESVAEPEAPAELVHKQPAAEPTPIKPEETPSTAELVHQQPVAKPLATEDARAEQETSVDPSSEPAEQQALAEPVLTEQNVIAEPAESQPTTEPVAESAATELAETRVTTESVGEPVAESTSHVAEQQPAENVQTTETQQVSLPSEQPTGQLEHETDGVVPAAANEADNSANVNVQ